ncbi:TIGR03086 family protein [Aeromicrobium sp. SMF47]|nr:TIGR03086 family protein [Aeromicrobium yanjiei]
MAAMDSPADAHREVARIFSERVAGVRDWDAPAPVEGWTARDVVGHLVGWLPGFLSGGGVELPSGPSVAHDPVAAWRHHADAVQSLLESGRAAEDFTHPQAGTQVLGRLVESFYVADVFMHTWDLARASGQDDSLDPARCEALLAGMRSIEELLRSSGQYGPAVPVPEDAPVQDRLMGFIGRDPAWTP